uniref:Uncharacterized protein n=1 Tax=viral metagenome TaxID=1070528 RepID=A0A6M3Y1H1_9ZZZZ
MSVFDSIQKAESEAFRYKKRACRLRKRIVALKKALQEIADGLVGLAGNRDCPDECGACEEKIEIAQKALKRGKND